MLIAASATIGAVAFVGGLLAVLFRQVDEQSITVTKDFDPDLGGWQEQKVRNATLGTLKLPQQPVNTYTNLFYLGAGLFVGVWLDTPASYAFAATMTYLCVGSAMYHAMSTRWARMLDNTGIYAVYASTATYAAAILTAAPDWVIPGAMFIIAAAAAVLLAPKFSEDSELKIAFFLGATYLFIVLQMARNTGWESWPWVVASFGSFLVGFICWLIDKRGQFVFPRWGHGIWHFFTAAASGLLFYSIVLVSA